MTVPIYPSSRKNFSAETRGPGKHAAVDTSVGEHSLRNLLPYNHLRCFQLLHAGTEFVFALCTGRATRLIENTSEYRLYMTKGEKRSL